MTSEANHASYQSTSRAPTNQRNSPWCAVGYCKGARHLRPPTARLVCETDQINQPVALWVLFRAPLGYTAGSHRPPRGDLPNQPV